MKDCSDREYVPAFPEFSDLRSKFYLGKKKRKKEHSLSKIGRQNCLNMGILQKFDMICLQ